MTNNQRFKALRQFYESQAEIVANGISTTIASTKQFTEYLNDIYAFSYAKGVLLEVPQDLAWCRG